MRLFLLPISTRRALIYYDKSILAKQASIQQPGIIDRLTTKASTTWSDWERAEAGWKKQLTTYGNAALRRIPFEEWGLKTVPTLTARRKEEMLKEKKPVEVLIPGAYLQESKVGDLLHRIAMDRQPLHRKRMYGSLIGAPLTLPFALVPILPNIPGFYLLFRGYSHWKALSGAQHLQFLVENKLFKTSSSPIMDKLYTAGLLYPTRKESREAPDPTIEQVVQVADSVDQQLDSGADEVMLLKRWNGKLIAEQFNLPDMEVEIERAVEQVEKQVLKPSDIEAHKPDPAKPVEDEKVKQQ
jgi:hypothetical protein